MAERAQDRKRTKRRPLDDLKEEVAEEVGVNPDEYGGNVPAKKWGALGGHMVRRLIKEGKEELSEDEEEGGTAD